MVHKGMAHDDDEPLLPLMDHDSVRMKEIQQTQRDDILKSTKLSGSTVHDSISSSGSEDPDHPHHHPHSHNHGHVGRVLKRPSSSMDSSDLDRMYLEEDNEDDHDPLSLEALKAAEKDKMKLKIAIGLCSTFFFVELGGGLWSESLALLSDSFHLLTDITSFIISLVAIYLSHRPPTATHTFGYHRAEVLGALFSIFLIWGLTLLLVIEAFDRVRHPIDVDGKTMSVIAGLGVFVNILLMFVLGGHHHHHGDDDHEHGHSHGLGHGSGSHDHRPLHNDEDHEHDHSHECGHNRHKAIPQHDHDHHNNGPSHSTQPHSHHHHSHVNLNITAATLHVLGDLLSSIGVLISSLVITFYPSMTYLDPICTFIFSILVICTTVGVFKRSVSILMEGVPRGINMEEVRDAICDIPGVLEVKALHIWSLTIGQPALSATFYLQPEIKDVKRAASIVKRARAMLRSRYGIRESTLQIEMYAPHGGAREIAAASTPSSSLSMHRHAPASSSSSFSGSTATTIMNGRATAMDALARHEQDVIFSLEDELDRDYDLDHGAHRGQLFGDIHRAGTPLSQYKENRNVLASNEEDESEDEMEQETLQLHPEQQPHRWS